MWALACTQPGSEQKAFDNITRQGFETYWPRYFKDRPRSLFPSYLFVQTESQHKSPWRVLLSTYGVRRLLMRHNGESLEPQPVPQKIIDDLRSQEVDGFYQFPGPPPKFLPRQTLRATDGLLMGNFCICEEMTGNDRVRVLFTGMGFQFRTEMSADHLEAV